MNDTEAKIVQENFTRFLAGETLVSIADDLNARSIPTKRAGQKGKGKGINPTWTGHSIRMILKNVSYTGNQVLQKHFTDWDFKIKVNRGQHPQYYHENHHPAIIDKATFEIEVVDGLVIKINLIAHGPYGSV